MGSKKLSSALFWVLPLLVACQAGQPRPKLAKQSAVRKARPTAVAPTANAPKSPPARKKKSMAVVTTHPEASRAALRILRAGGSAADAAIAAMAALGVVHPVSSGLGGGGTLLYWNATKKKATVLDFRAAAAAGLNPKDHRTRPRGRRRGALVGVPGQAAGWARMHALFGTMPFAKLMAPAILLAKSGFRPSPHLLRSLSWNRRWLKHSRMAAVLLSAKGQPAAARMRNPALAKTLASLAAKGPKSFYQEPLASDVIATARAVGGDLELSDLQQYQVIEREPLATRWHGHRVLTAPAPSGGGVLLLQLLAMHRPEELRAFGYGSGSYYHRLADAFRGSIADRLRAIGDPSFANGRVERLLAPKRLQKRKASFASHKTRYTEDYALDEHGTSQLLVVDAKGNVANVTCSLGSMYGARLIARGGFALNDALSNFTHERTERRFGSRNRPNIPRPGARPAHSWTPTLVVKNGRLRFALGASGGMHIPTAVAQVLLATLLFERPIARAVADMRLRLETGGTLLLPPAAPASLKQDLRARGEVHRSDIPNYSAVQIISIKGDGPATLTATGDRRKGSAVELH